MVNRLAFFREQMAAFEGAANPLKAIESGYYVNAPGKSIAETLALRLSLRPASKHLLLGGIGSGKTTQLLQIRDRLNTDIDDIYAHYVDISSYTDIFDSIRPGVLVAIAGLILSELVETNKERVDLNANIEIIRHFAYGCTEKQGINKTIEAIFDLPDSPVLEGIKPITKRHEGLLKKNSSIQFSKLLKSVSKIHSFVADKYGKFVLLFDGLDRLNDVQTFANIVTTDLENLFSLDIGSILVGPLRLSYTDYRDTIEQAVDSIHYQPCFDVENDSEAHTFFEEILNKRSALDFIESTAIHSLVHHSGGLLRDLISLTQSSIEEAYLSGSEHLTQAHILTAVDTSSRSRTIGLTEDDIKQLVQVLNSDDFYPTTQASLRLLAEGRILEYRYPEKRYAVHPILALAIRHIQKQKKA